MKIRLSPSFLVFVAAIFLLNAPCYTLIFLSSALIHEAGHLVCLKFLGAKKPELSLGLCGAVINADMSRLSYRSEILVFLSGAGFNVVFCALALLLFRWGGNVYLLFLFFANLFYAILNLLPIRNFDGGNILERLLYILFDPWSAEKISSVIFFATSLCLALLSFFAARLFGFNLTLLLISLSALLQCIPSKPCCLRAS